MSKKGRIRAHSKRTGITASLRPDVISSMTQAHRKHIERDAFVSKNKEWNMWHPSVHRTAQGPCPVVKLFRHETVNVKS